MSDNNGGGEKPSEEGMQTEGLPVGPEIKEHSQYDPKKQRTGQPGIQEEMETQPIDTLLPTHHAHQGLHDQLQMDEYKGVGKFNSKVCLVTGGDSGIGRSIALMLAKEGAQCVAITYVEKEKVDADKTKELIEKEMIGGPGSTKPVQSRLFCQDLSQGEDSCKAIISQLSSEYGRIDCLFLNHAIQYYSPSIENTSEDILMDTFKTNFFSFVYLAKHAIPMMPRGGAIVCSTSVTAYVGSPSLLEYSCTKGAIVSFVRSLAKQVASKGIRVNAVAAGPIWTPLQVASFPEPILRSGGPLGKNQPPLGHIGQIHTPLNPASRPPEGLEHWESKDAKVPLGRLGQPAEAATSYIFLASQESSYMTGQVLHPNGGMWTSS